MLPLTMSKIRDLTESLRPIRIGLPTLKIVQPQGDDIEAQGNLVWSRNEGLTLDVHAHPSQLYYPVLEAGTVSGRDQMWRVQGLSDAGLTLDVVHVMPNRGGPEMAELTPPPGVIRFSPWSALLSETREASPLCGYSMTGVLRSPPIPCVWHGMAETTRKDSFRSEEQQQRDFIYGEVDGGRYYLRRVEVGWYWYEFKSTDETSLSLLAECVVRGLSIACSGMVTLCTVMTEIPTSVSISLRDPRLTTLGPSRQPPIPDLSRSGPPDVINAVHAMESQGRPVLDGLRLANLLWEASSSPAEVQAAMASTVLEGMVSVFGDHFDGVEAPDIPTLEEVQELVEKLRASGLAESPHFARIEGFVKSLRNIGIKGTFEQLVTLKTPPLTRSEYRAWNNVRQRVLHGNFNLEPAQLIGDLTIIWNGINRLSLAACGYQGEFHDRSQQHWPIVELDFSLVQKLRRSP